MTISKMIGAVAGIGGTVTFYSLNSLLAKEKIDCHDCHMKRLPKAHELPLYDKNEELVLEYDEQTKLPLLSEISTVRQQVSGLFSYVSGFKEEVSHAYQTGVAHSKSSYDYIISEENRIPRILAVISGGLAGYVLARKRGIFRKVLYTSVGCGLVFSAFYPTVAKEYVSIGWEHTKYHTSSALEKYGGYDTQKLADETKEKMEVIQSTLKLEGLTNKLKEWFDKNKEKVTSTLNINTDSKVNQSTVPKDSTKKDL